MNNLFVTSGLSKDGNYRLKSNSNNINGCDGSPRGAFGGAAITNRYVLSGTAAVPVIYDIETTGVASQSNGLKATIKARSIK